MKCVNPKLGAEACLWYEVGDECLDSPTEWCNFGAETVKPVDPIIQRIEKLEAQIKELQKLTMYLPREE